MPASLSTRTGDFVRCADGVLIEPGHAFLAPAGGPQSHYRLGYSSISPAKIPEGIARIARAMQSGVKTPP